MTALTGLGVFGRAYRRMFENDPHAPGSVDRVLLERMTLLCDATAEQSYGPPPELRYVPGSAPALECHTAAATEGADGDESRVEAIAAFTGRIAVAGDAVAVRDLVFGGLEEEIADRATDWCTDLARLACVLCQVSGIPARIVVLADPSRAYWAHQMIEAYRKRAWGAVCPTTNVVYRHRDGRPASAWDLQRDAALVEAHARGDETPYTDPRMFSAIAIADYAVWERERYDYTTSRVNDYKLAILEMAERGWPGGVRWLHGEDA